MVTGVSLTLSLAYWPPRNPVFGAEIFVMSHIQAELNTNFLLKFSNFCYHGNKGGSSKIRMTPFD